MRISSLICGCLLLTALFTAGCLMPSSGLSDTSWMLIAYADAGGEMVRADAVTTFYFSDDGTLNGNAACNSYSAEYRRSDDQLVIGSVVMTEMYCTDESRMEPEIRFITLLGDVRSYRIDGDILMMYGAGGDELLISGRTTRIR
jgi:heat shock protein HslJ